MANPRGNKRLAGAVCMVGSAFFFALVGVGVKLAGSQVGIWQISFYRALVGIVLMAAVALVYKVPLVGPDLKLLSLRGLSGTFGFLSMMMALRQIPLAEVMVLFYMFPAFAALFSPWLNDERLAPRDWLFLALAFAGTLVILFRGGGIQLCLGHIYALITAVLAGLNTSLVRRLSSRHSPYAIYFFFCLAAAVVSIWPLAIGSEPVLSSGIGMLYLVGIGVVATFGQVLMNQGFFHLPAAEGGVVLMSQVVIAAAWGVVMFGEPISWRLVVGGCMIMLGGAFLNRSSRKRSAGERVGPEANG
ncbi:DMT family transporter [Desulfoferula mesophila]|uniref:EamA domain-containing protein n=1 Tax=Desulfoferula mesophila TaxID=3058419 RepID=A0AAU9EL98_9BACT|nr:hypothetical protein FAK_18070 [Desulfoferula mesophilus]